MITFEELEKEIKTKTEEVKKRKEKIEQKIKENHTKITNTHREREKAKEVLDTDKYTSLGIELVSLKETAEMLEGQKKECEYKIKNVSSFLDNSKLNKLHDYTEQENLKLFPEWEKHIKALERLKEQSIELVSNYENVSNLFFKEDRQAGKYSITAPWEYKGYDLTGIDLQPLKNRIESAREKGFIK
ncbi:hypothetical protein P7J30_05925 [Streptococcus suis]|uniref:hypothetical protein n=1 Tax=Streptococcus suis TaxID=1307 RepID=UPI001A99B436|nr:hypothetical protein [Streptococcus suis]QTA56883.1 hypothetical protein J1N58_11540 [Streptococcus suis]